MLYAHTITEARLYLRITGCRKCGGALHLACETINATSPAEIGLSVVLTGHCAACTAPQDFVFSVAQAHSIPRNERPASVNETPQPSTIIDVGQWITLARLFLEEDRTQKDRRQARILSLQAAQCLGEALKFYDDPENDLPPPEALFCETSRQRFRQSPEQFSRKRLIGEKSKLPVAFD